MADIFSCDPHEITPDASPDTLKVWDSMKTLDLVLAIEQETGLELPTDHLEEMISVPALLAAIEAARAG